MIATAVSVANLPEHEKPIIVDIYLGLWVDSVVRHGKGIDGPALKTEIARLWTEYRPLIIEAGAEPLQNVHDPNSAAMRLALNVDRLADVARDESRQMEVAVRFKALISDIVWTVGAFASQRASNGGPLPGR